MIVQQARRQLITVAKPVIEKACSNFKCNSDSDNQLEGSILRYNCDYDEGSILRYNCDYDG